MIAEYSTSGGVLIEKWCYICIARSENQKLKSDHFSIVRVSKIYLFSTM